MTCHISLFNNSYLDPVVSAQMMRAEEEFECGQQKKCLKQTNPVSTFSVTLVTTLLALVIPAIVLIIFGIMILGNQMDPGDLAYLLLLFVLFIPAGPVLFLVSRLRILSKFPPE